MGYGRPDRVPYFEEGIRKNVLKAWQTQGLAKATDLKTMFPSDHRERMQVDLEPRPKFVSKLDKITCSSVVWIRSTKNGFPEDGPGVCGNGSPGTMCSCCTCIVDFF